MLDHPLQFLLALALLLGLLIWRFRARRAGKERAQTLSTWRKWIQATLLGLATLVLLIVAVEATRFVGISFCLDLWSDQNWCNHPGDSQTGTD